MFLNKKKIINFFKCGKKRLPKHVRVSRQIAREPKQKYEL